MGGAGESLWGGVGRPNLGPGAQEPPHQKMYLGVMI